MYSDYQNDIKKFLRMEFLFDPKESIIASERKVNFFRTDFIVLQQPLSHRNRKALHVLTAGRSEMGLSTTTALDMLSGLFYDLTGMQALFHQIIA